MKLIDKKFLSNARVNYAAQLLNIGLGFLSVTMVVKFAGLEVYGMLAALLALGATVSNFVSFRTNEALVRFYRRGTVKNNPELKYFAVAAGIILDLGTSLILFTIIQLCSTPIGSYLLKSATEQNSILLFSCMASANFLRGTGYGLLTAQERFNTISILSSIEQLFKVVFLGLGILKFEKLELSTVVLLMFSSSIPITLFYVWITIKKIAWPPQRRWMRKKWRKIYWQFSASTFTSATLKSGHKNLDSVFLSYFSNPTIVGLYSLFRQFLSPIDMMATPYASQIYPKFVDALSRRSIETINVAIQEGSKMLLKQTLLIVIPIFLASYCYLTWNGIQLASWAYLAFLILLSTSMILQRLWWSRAFSLASRPHLSIYANALGMAITLSVMPPLILSIGDLLGAALSTLIGAVALHIFWNRELKVAYANLHKNA